MVRGQVLAAALGLAMAFTTMAVAATPARLEIPVRIIGKSAPLLVVRIQARDVPLWLDLGMATPLSLHPALLGELTKRDTGRSFSSVGMEGAVMTSPVATLDQVEVGGVVFADVPVIRDGHDDAYLATQLPPGSGAVGAGFFAGYQLVIDYRRRRLTLIPDRQPEEKQSACRGDVVPLVQDPTVDWGLVSRVQTDVGEQLFVWDTGSPGLVMLKANAFRAGLDTSQATTTLAHVRMNGHEYGPLRFDLRDFPAPERMAGFLGYDFFATHVICVDFAGHRVRVR